MNIHNSSIYHRGYVGTIVKNYNISGDSKKENHRKHKAVILHGSVASAHNMLEFLTNYSYIKDII
jgi:hypothetical protein